MNNDEKNGCYEENGKLICNPEKFDIYLFETPEKLNDIFPYISKCDEVHLSDCDFSSLQELKFKNGAEI